MGKAGKLALSELRTMEKSTVTNVTLSKAQKEAMSNLLHRYRSGVPGSLKVQKTTLPCVVFTDGACESGNDGSLQCIIGGVIFEPGEDSRPEVFGVFVPDAVIQKWMDADKVHPVAQTELYAE